MTIPLTGGRHITVNPGSQPAYLSERAKDATVINTGADRVWLAADPGDLPQSGVPLEGGTSIPWRTGQLWVAPDPAAAGPVLLVLTGAVTQWAPSPAAIAIQVAEQLLAGGIPIVQAFAKLDSRAAQTAVYTSPVFDVGTYASLAIRLFAQPSLPNGALVPVTINWYSDALGTDLVDADTWAYIGTTYGNPITTMRIPTRARYCKITIAVAPVSFTFAFTIYASTIPTPTALLRSRQITDSTNPNGYAAYPLLAHTAFNIPAGSSISVYLGPVAQSVRLVMDPTNAASGLIIATLQAATLDINGAENTVDLAAIPNNPTGEGAASADCTVPFGSALVLQIDNNDTSTRSPKVEVWDTSPS